MTDAALIAATQTRFTDTFGPAPDAVAFASGRVNLLGEHTDYNGGLVLPMPLTMGTAVALGYGGTAGTVEIASADFDGKVTRSMTDQPDGSWTDYVLGSLMQIFNSDAPQSGWRVMIQTNLPVGAGLSSSAALEVALMRAYCDLTGADHSPVDIAAMARAAENQFVGVPCGIMDQYSVSVGTPGSAVFLDTRALTSELAPLPADHNFVIVHSGVSHQLSDGGYEQRVAECRAACTALEVEMLSDLGPADLDQIATLPAPLDGRARHIITENQRVKDAVSALTAGDTDRFAQLMNDSHASQRDDYAVSVPDVDALVEGALAAGAKGSRLTGGGFGGSVVSLVASDQVEDWCKTIDAKFPDARVLAVT